MGLVTEGMRAAALRSAARALPWLPAPPVSCASEVEKWLVRPACRALAELDGGHGCGLLAPDCMPIHQPVDLLGLEPPVAVQVPLGEVSPHDLGEPLAELEPKAPRRGEGQSKARRSPLEALDHQGSNSVVLRTTLSVRVRITTTLTVRIANGSQSIRAPPSSASATSPSLTCRTPGMIR